MKTNTITGEEKEMVRRTLVELEDTKRQLELKDQEMSWLRKQLYNQKADAETGWKPDSDTPPQLYRGFKLTRMTPYGFVIITNMDGSKPAHELQSSFTTFDIAKKFIDEHKKEDAIKGNV